MNLGERKQSSKIQQPHILEFTARFFMLFVTSVPSPGNRGSQIHGLSSTGRHGGFMPPREQQHPDRREYGCLVCPTPPLKSCQLLCLQPWDHQGDALLLDDKVSRTKGHRGLEGLQGTEETLTPPRGKLRYRGITKRRKPSPGGTSKGTTRSKARGIRRTPGRPLLSGCGVYLQALWEMR